MSSTNPLIEYLAAFQLAPVQHTDYTDNTKKWLKTGVIGEGRFGVVRLEEESRTKELRAVKTVEIRADSRISPLREIHALAMLTKYFVEFRGWWEEHDADRNIHRLHIAMEYCKEGDLEKYLQKRRVEEEEGKTIMKQVFEGLDFLHGKGFAHRDIKPSNIFIAEVSPQVRIKIGDLGLAKYTGADSGTVLHTNAGSMDYIAPEVNGMSVPDERETDRYTSAVDIWSSGCLAHTILTNQPPFAGGRNLFRYLSGQKGFPAERLVERNVSEPAQGLLIRMLAPASHNRPTAKECLEDAWMI